jgi:hypothetical protein
MNQKLQWSLEVRADVASIKSWCCFFEQAASCFKGRHFPSRKDRPLRIVLTNLVRRANMKRNGDDLVFFLSDFKKQCARVKRKQTILVREPLNYLGSVIVASTLSRRRKPVPWRLKCFVH